MSDNLVERLRNWETVYEKDYEKPEGSLYLEAADYIQELEERRRISPVFTAKDKENKDE